MFFNYIIRLVEKLIKERNTENLPVKISWHSSKINDFTHGMKEIKDLLNKNYEGKFISYNPSNVDYTKTFVIIFQLQKSSVEHATGIKQIGGD